MTTDPTPSVNAPGTPELWRTEYEAKSIPSSFKSAPSGSVVAFLTFLRDSHLPAGYSALDIGCGTGRNSRYLAQSGFLVTAMDFVENLVLALNKSSEDSGYKDRITAIVHDIGLPWPFQDNSFDLAIDTFCFKHQVSEAAKQNYHTEIRRVLKPGAPMLITLAGVDDGYYGPLLASSPDPQRRVIVDPVNRIPSILYTRADLLAEFGDAFKELRHQNKRQTGEMHGRLYPRSTHIFILQKHPA